MKTYETYMKKGKFNSKSWPEWLPVPAERKVIPFRYFCQSCRSVFTDVLDYRNHNCVVLSEVRNSFIAAERILEKIAEEAKKLGLTVRQKK